MVTDMRLGAQQVQDGLRHPASSLDVTGKAIETDGKTNQPRGRISEPKPRLSIWFYPDRGDDRRDPYLRPLGHGGSQIYDFLALREIERRRKRLWWFASTSSHSRGPGRQLLQYLF